MARRPANGSSASASSRIPAARSLRPKRWDATSCASWTDCRLHLRHRNRHRRFESPYKRLGDLVAGTVVVHEKKFADIRPLWQAPAQSTGPPRIYGAAHLSPEEAALIETYLNRRDALDPGIRYHMADQIFRRIRPKLTFPEADYPSVERVLEALAVERRSSARYL